MPIFAEPESSEFFFFASWIKDKKNTILFFYQNLIYSNLMAEKAWGIKLDPTREKSKKSETDKKTLISIQSKTILNESTNGTKYKNTGRSGCW